MIHTKMSISVLMISALVKETGGTIQMEELYELTRYRKDLVRQ